MSSTSTYKTVSHANMSHELRTPLNSLLILSDQLAKNGEGNLTPRQVEFSKTIHASGNDLLTLINDILDLSKIESGTVIVDVGEVPFRDLGDYVERTFRHVAENKRLDFGVEVAGNMPRSMHTDAKRLQQILKNLLSNAFKFTERGRVSLEVKQVTGGWHPENESLNRARTVIAMSVTDTGIGIPPEKQQIIFEAFQQADGSTSRKYGGTGLGLAISREIAGLLGGEIKLSSTPGQGSTFTLYLPQHYAPAKTVRRQPSDMPPALPPSNAAIVPVQRAPDGGVIAAGAAAVEPAPATDTPGEQQTEFPAVTPNILGDDLGEIQPGDRILLIVENDTNFARFLLEVGHEQGFKAVIATRGAAALQLARELRPDAITLDINLPDIDGWRVLNRLKDDVATRHIPVQVITRDEERERPLRMGAMGVLTKPVRTKETLDETFGKIKRYIEPHTRRVVVIEPDPVRRVAVCDQISAEGVEAACVGTATEAWDRLRDGQRTDLIVASLDLPDKPGFDLIDEIKEDPAFKEVPLLVHLTRDLNKKEQVHLKRLTQATVVKEVRSPERLLDEVTLFLHRRIDSVTPDQKRMI